MMNIFLFCHDMSCSKEEMVRLARLDEKNRYDASPSILALSDDI